MSKRIIHPKKEKRKKERGKRKEIRSNWSIWALRGWRFKPHIDYLKSARGPDPWEGGKETCLRSRENHVIQYHGWMLLCKSSQRIPANVESNMLDWSLGFTVKAKCIAACACKWTVKGWASRMVQWKITLSAYSSYLAPFPCLLTERWNRVSRGLRALVLRSNPRTQMNPVMT